MKTQILVNPFNDVMKLQEKVGNIFENVMQNANKEFSDFTLWRPTGDVHEFDNYFEVELELPGVKKEDINLNFEDKTLVVNGEKKSSTSEILPNSSRKERYYGKFSRKIIFNVSINADNIDAKFENGILLINLPKSDEVKPRNIEIK